MGLLHAQKADRLLLYRVGELNERRASSVVQVQSKRVGAALHVAGLPAVAVRFRVAERTHVLVLDAGTRERRGELRFREPGTAREWELPHVYHSFDPGSAQTLDELDRGASLVTDREEGRNPHAAAA